MRRRHDRGKLPPPVPWTDVIAIFADLRREAGRARRLAGYKPRNGLPRSAWAQGLQGLAQTIYSRRQRGLSVDWHMAQAREMLRMSP